MTAHSVAEHIGSIGKRLALVMKFVREAVRVSLRNM
jgi:hypothetical protein